MVSSREALVCATRDSPAHWTLADTLWASGYEVYDRISEPYQKFLDSLTATYAQPGFNRAAKDNEFELYTAPRGSPENIGDELRAIHPVIRTNPVTGWKSVFAVGNHVEKVNDVTEDESKHLLDWFVNLIVENHDLQVRYRWQNANDLGRTCSVLHYYLLRDLLLLTVVLQPFGITEASITARPPIMPVLGPDLDSEP